MAVHTVKLEPVEEIKEMTYEEWENEFYNRKWNKVKTFLKTLPFRMFGVIFIVATILLTIHVDGEFIIAWFVTIPLGLFLTFAKSETLLNGDVIKW